MKPPWSPPPLPRRRRPRSGAGAAAAQMGTLGAALVLALPAAVSAQPAPTAAPPSSATPDAPAPAFAPAAAAARLALTVVVDGEPQPAPLAALQRGPQVLLPLGALARLLRLDIRVHPERASASGFVLGDASSFDLDLGADLVRIGGRERSFDPRHVAATGDEIYVAAPLLARWLQIELEIDGATGELRASPSRPLSLAQRIARDSGARAGTPGPEAAAVALELEIDGKRLPGAIAAQLDGPRVLLPLGELARRLGLAIDVDPAQGTAHGYVNSGAGEFDLDVAESRVSVGGRQRSFEARNVAVFGNEIHVAAALLGHWLPVDFEVDLAASRLRARPRVRLPVADRIARDRVAAQSPPVPAETRVRNLEANLLVLEVQLDGHVLSDSLNAYVDGRQILLPLGELARLLTLAIAVRPDQGSASGYVFREDRSFELHLAESTVSLAGRTQIFESRLASVIGDDLYVSSQLLAHWLPIDFKVDLPTLQLRVHPRQRLPLQERLAREGAAARIASATETRDPGYPRLTSPHRWVSAPLIDQTLGTQARLGHGRHDVQASYTAYLTADVLAMEGAAYISSTRDRPAPDLRLTLGRHDPEGGLLGPLNARSVVVGHVALPGVANVMGASPQGVGLTLSNRPLNQPTSFDRHTLRGDLPPGWDVTLYYNDALVRYQQARPDGQYVFDDLPLAFGPNEFRLVFNGPLGQVRVERQRFLLDQSLVKPGELLYAAAHHRAEHGGERSVVQFDFGLTSAIAANAGLVRVPTGGTGGTGSAAYSQFGLRGYGSALIVNAQLTTAERGGALAELGVKTRLGAFSVDLQHLQRQGRFASDLFTAGAGALRYRDKIGVSGAVKLGGLPPMSVTVEAFRDQAVAGASKVGVQGRVSTVVAGTSVSNSLDLQRGGPLPASAAGSLQLSRRVLDIGFSAQLDYSLRPALALHNVAVNADRNLGDGYRVNAGLQHNTGADTTTVSAGLSKNLGSYGLALSGSVSSRRDVALSLQLFVALGRDPRSGSWSVDAQPLAGTGAVAARAFLDRNLNGIRDPGEELIANAGFVLNGGGRHPQRTNEAGEVFIGRLPPGQYTDIALDPATLEDPQWRPLTPGVRILPRPGVVETIDFPVAFTTDVEGTVYLLEKGKRRGIGDARVELVDSQSRVVTSTTSSGDGYYLLPQVFPGRFTLRIAPEQAAKLNLGGALERTLDVKADGDPIAGQDFELRIVPR